MRELAFVAGSLALGLAPAARAADVANDAASPSMYEQAVEAGLSAVSVSLGSVVESADLQQSDHASEFCRRTRRRSVRAATPFVAWSGCR